MAKGDHIFVNRFGGTYGHHGIDCGDGSVIHYSGRDWGRNRVVHRTSLDEFALTEPVQVRDYHQMETLLKPGTMHYRVNYQLSLLFNRLHGIEIDALDMSPDAVVARAEARLGERSFHIVLHNCEHFATWCKTGINNSEQVNLLLKALVYNEALSHLPTHKLLLGLQQTVLDVLEIKRPPPEDQ